MSDGKVFQSEPKTETEQLSSLVSASKTVDQKVPQTVPDGVVAATGEQFGTDVNNGDNSTEWKSNNKTAGGAYNIYNLCSFSLLAYIKSITAWTRPMYL